MERKVFYKSQLINLILAVIIILTGTFIMICPVYGLSSPILYISTVFMALSFFYIIAYFIDRKSSMYENLFNTLIYVIAGAFMFLCQDKTQNLILGTGLLMLVLLIVSNRVYYSFILKTNNNPTWIVKILTTFLITFLSGLVIGNLFKEVTSVQTLVFGYFFITFGIIMAFEPIIGMIIFRKDYEEYLDFYLKKSETAKKTNKKVKSVPTKKVKKVTKKNTTIKKTKNVRKKSKSLTKNK